MDNKKIAGHISAVFCCLVWGTTFISSKILLDIFTPIELLFIRFVIGFAILCIMSPKILKVKSKEDEIYFAISGFTGVGLYYLLENVALTYSYASNVGVIVSSAPLFTAILAFFFIKEEKLTKNFFIGFVSAMAGIILISFNGASQLQLNPIGDILAVFAAFIWGIYTITTRKITQKGYTTIEMTKRIFLYGVILMMVLMPFTGFDVKMSDFKEPVVIFNIIYLGVCASALCFVAWNYTMKVLGAIKSSVYIYTVPVVTVIASVIILNEKITAMTVAGTVLTLMGLVLSERKKES